jgi:hypothetical protein
MTYIGGGAGERLKEVCEKICKPDKEFLEMIKYLKVIG